MLGVSRDVVVELCDVGELRGWRTRSGHWIDIEESSVVEWRAAHRGLSDDAEAPTPSTSRGPADGELRVQLPAAGAARALDISEEIVTGLCESGELRAHRTHRGIWFIQEDSLLAWRAAHSGIPIDAPLRQYDPCHFCGKHARQRITRMVPIGDGGLVEREVAWCGSC